MSYKDYDFDNDLVFQKGREQLIAKLSKTGEAKEDIEEEIKEFYFLNILQNNNNEEIKGEIKGEIKREIKEETEKLTFQQIVKLIEEGKPVPGIKSIPNKINEGKPSDPQLKPRLKPWEKQ
ncbi:hypothetical protein K502DRAFT_365934 [Neoconidiobolus thromboides FSU 785]|nr:hypothetical protein K502DRAFT_365934 [Neoconidiobolus thromboides FSU 785]